MWVNRWPEHETDSELLGMGYPQPRVHRRHRCLRGIPSRPRPPRPGIMWGGRNERMWGSDEFHNGANTRAVVSIKTFVGELVLKNVQSDPPINRPAQSAPAC